MIHHPDDSNDAIVEHETWPSTDCEALGTMYAVPRAFSALDRSHNHEDCTIDARRGFEPSTSAVSLRTTVSLRSNAGMFPLGSRLWLSRCKRRVEH